MGKGNERKDGMTLDDYQLMAGRTAIYPGKDTGSVEAVNYTALGLAGEAGEICNRFKKVLRDSGGKITPETREDLAGELGDVLWYVAQMARELHAPLSAIAASNLAKLEGRRERGTICGSGEGR